MIVAILIVLGLIFGSFVNALVWRLHEQETLVTKTKKSKNKKRSKELSIIKGRSMCTHCGHQLAGKDLIPVLSWLELRGKCRYCHKVISPQYPLVELATAGLFVASYVWWPESFNASQTALFSLWIVLVVGLMALLVYDARWSILPNRIVYPLSIVATVMALVTILSADRPLVMLLNVVLAVGAGGGIFYVLYQVSSGKWIGGGDVRLGWLLGLVLATPGRALLMIFVASLAGSLVSLPLLFAKRLKRTSVVPFGPFLIIAAVIVQLFGHIILHWYQKTFFPYMF